MKATVARVAWFVIIAAIIVTLASIAVVAFVILRYGWPSGLVAAVALGYLLDVYFDGWSRRGSPP